MKVLPAIDLKDGNCVRLFKGNFSQVTKYNDDPISQVKTFLDHDLNYLHIVDLDGAESGNQLNINLIKENMSESLFFNLEKKNKFYASNNEHNIESFLRENLTKFIDERKIFFNN